MLKRKLGPDVRAKISMVFYQLHRHGSVIQLIRTLAIIVKLGFNLRQSKKRKKIR